MTALWPLATCWLAGAALLFADGRRRPVAVLAAALALAVLALDLALLVQLATGAREPLEVVTGGWPAGLGIRLRVDLLSAGFSTLCAGVLAVVLAHEAASRACGRLFPALVLLLDAGLHGAFATGDLFDFYVFFELSVVSSFALAAYGYGRAEVRGTFVYVAMNLIGSALFLFGVAAVYLSEGTLDLAQLAAEPAGGEERDPRLLASTLLFVALSLKLGLFPFHSWVPVVYVHARPAVAAALAGALVNLGVFGLLRLGFTVFDDSRAIGAGVLIALGAAAGLYGALLSIRRERPAEVSAYGSIVHAGYVVLGLGLGGPHGVAAALLATVAGSVDKAALFLSLEAGPRARRTAALLSSISVGGLPFTAGFLTKIELFRGALVAPAAAATTLALLAMSVLTLVGAFRFVRLSRREDGAGAPAVLGVGALVLAGATVAVGVAPWPVLSVVRQAGARLLGVPE